MHAWVVSQGDAVYKELVVALRNVMKKGWSAEEFGHTFDGWLNAHVATTRMRTQAQWTCCSPERCATLRGNNDNRVDLESDTKSRNCNSLRSRGTPRPLRPGVDNGAGRSPTRAAVRDAVERCASR